MSSDLLTNILETFIRYFKYDVETRSSYKNSICEYFHDNGGTQLLDDMKTATDEMTYDLI